MFGLEDRGRLDVICEAIKMKTEFRRNEAEGVGDIDNKEQGPQERALRNTCGESRAVNCELPAVWSLHLLEENNYSFLLWIDKVQKNQDA